MIKVVTKTNLFSSDVTSYSAKTRICVSCLTPSTQVVTGASSFSSVTAQINTIFNKTILLSSTVQLPNSTRIPFRVSSPTLSKQNDSVMTINAVPESSSEKIDILDTARIFISTTSWDTRIKSVSSLSFWYRSVSLQNVTASLTSSTIITKAEKPCSGLKCTQREDKPKRLPPHKDEEFKLTLPIKYGFFAAGMVIPIIVTFAIAVYGSYR